MKDMKAIVSLSGGMDSATVLFHARGYFDDVTAVTFKYGSKHNKYELQAAQALAKFIKVPLHIIDLSVVFLHMKSNLLSTGGDVPEGHYEEKSMAATVVPGRNSIFISILTGIAQSMDTIKVSVYLGVHAGDHAIYPDCRGEYVKAMANAMALASDGKVTIYAPFLKDDKSRIIQRGNNMHVPYHLTRTCYKDQEIACGKCGSCQERLEAFQILGERDPIDYESRGILPKKGATV